MHDRRLAWYWSLLSLLVLSAAAWFMFKSFSYLDYDWDFAFLKDYLWDSVNNAPGLILQGLWVTLKVSLLSIVWGTIIGVMVGAFMMAREPVLKWFSVIFVDVFRNTPVLVQLYVMYFIVGTAIEMDPETAGIVTLSLFCAAYVAEIFRGAVLEFEKGQIDAAKSMGLSPLQIAYHVAAPQVLRRMLPALVGQFVSLVKDSSLVSVISVADLTKSALNIVSVSFKSFETWFVVAILYCIVNTILSSYGRYLERRLRVS
ncbi:MAG: amino acid ABC transporter permease [Bdellovibrionota bacterium]